jgi:hypothetical protein
MKPEILKRYEIEFPDDDNKGEEGEEDSGL